MIFVQLTKYSRIRVQCAVAANIISFQYKMRFNCYKLSRSLFLVSRYKKLQQPISCSAYDFSIYRNCIDGTIKSRDGAGPRGSSKISGLSAQFHGDIWVLVKFIIYLFGPAQLLNPTPRMFAPPLTIIINVMTLIKNKDRVDNQ